jgi:hypothetical protein
MLKKTIIIFLFGFVSIKGYTQEKIINNGIITNTDLALDSMKINNRKTDSIINAGIIIHDSLVNITADKWKNSFLLKKNGGGENSRQNIQWIRIRCLPLFI